MDRKAFYLKIHILWYNVFVSNMHIALKETDETEYWLKLLTMSEYITEDMGKSLLTDCLEIKRILVASINTAKEAQ